MTESNTPSRWGLGRFSRQRRETNPRRRIVDLGDVIAIRREVQKMKAQPVEVWPQIEPHRGKRKTHTKPAKGPLVATHAYKGKPVKPGSRDPNRRIHT